MMTTDESLQSLLRALQPGYERPVPAAGWASFARRFLQSGEIVLFAFEGEGWTWVDPLLLVTDRRALHLRRGLRWRVLREVQAAEVRGADCASGTVAGHVRILLRDGSSLRTRQNVSKDEAVAQGFVDGVNRLVAGGGRSASRH
ncbi:hypothetical protein [Brachybacterium sp. AOP29-B2-41]|uniref:hypothetical protein n=1 Tax=Brachybacterium sp. AOP29-B2-41 TaxID=3457704 RepID=UPI00403360C2